MARARVRNRQEQHEQAEAPEAREKPAQGTTLPTLPPSQVLPTVLERLEARYPEARYELNWENPLQLLVATILAAQCTDERVNQVTPALFARYPDAATYASADLAELEEYLKPTGYFRQKAKTIQEVCKALVERFEGKVPPSMEDMTTLPRVARKTANVVLNHAFGLPTGVIVDTHVQRVSLRLGLTESKYPEKTERDLMTLVPQEKWIFFGPALVLLGRYTCTYREPRCTECVLNDLCPKRIEAEEEDSPPDVPAPEEEAAATEDSPVPTKKTKPKAKTPAKKKAAPTRSRSASRASPGSAAAVQALRARLPADWQAVLAAEFEKPYFQVLAEFVAAERAAHSVFPPEEDTFSAFHATPFEQVKVVLLGQDPYHDDGQAHGMAFSVRPGVKPPPSVVNMLRELHADLGFPPVEHGYLASWASQGVLLLNTVLTVKAHEPNAHKEKGWETFTDAVFTALNGRTRPLAFLLWGGSAQKKAGLIDASRHRVLNAAHPSPLSARKFFGSKPYSAANKALQELGQQPINWQLPADPNASLAPAPAPIPASLPAPTPAPKPAARTKAPTQAPAPPPPVAVPVSANNGAKEAPTALELLLPPDWRAALAGEFKKPYFKALDKFLASEWESSEVCPAKEDVFRAFRLTQLSDLRVVLLGMEPHSDGRADGLSYSVKPDAEPTPVLRTFFRSLREDLGYRIPVTGSLDAWARQGVLLLNAVLSVRRDRPESHKDKGWEAFTQAILKVINERQRPVVFALFGQQPQKRRSLVSEERHAVVTAENPEVTPEKFLDAKVFSAINDTLELRGQSAVYWQLPYV